MPKSDTNKIGEILEQTFVDDGDMTWTNGSIVLGTGTSDTGSSHTAVVASDFMVVTDKPYSVNGCYGGRKQKKVDFARGDFAFVQHGVQSASEVLTPGSHVFIGMAPGFRQNIEDSLSTKVNLDEPRTATSGLLTAPVYTQMIKDFVRSKGAGGTLRAESIVTLMLGDMIEFLDQRAVPDSAQGIAPKALSRLREYVSANLGQKITIEEMARQVNISQFHFMRCFKAATGKTPHQFVMQHRLEEAQRLLLATREPLAQIAYATGFSSQSHLTQAFGKYFGVSPAKYRAGT